MVLVIPVIRNELLPAEQLDICCSGTTLSQLHRILFDSACQRLDLKFTIHIAFNGQLLQATDTSLAAVGLSSSSTVHMMVQPPPPRIVQCEPAMSPAAGGLRIRIHGEGFTPLGCEGLRIRFGHMLVAAQRVTDAMLLCVAPAHPPGPVLVTLCCGDRDGDRNVRDQCGAAFEYVARIESMYDAIFSSTNSNCEHLEQEADESVVPSWTSM